MATKSQQFAETIAVAKGSYRDKTLISFMPQGIHRIGCGGLDSLIADG